MASDGLTQVPLVGHHLKAEVGTEGLGVGENCGVPKASGRESMIRSDYIDHGRSSRAIIMTKGRTLHCERETGGSPFEQKNDRPDGKIPNGSVTPSVSCELGLIETTEPTGGTQKGEYWGGPTNGQAAACRRRPRR